MRRPLTALLVAGALLGLAPARSADAVTTRCWYVDADAKSAGRGTLAAPFRTLAAVEPASRPGDTINVLPSIRALDEQPSWCG